MSDQTMTRPALASRRILRSDDRRLADVTAFVATHPGSGPVTVAARIDEARQNGYTEGYQAALGEIAAAEAAGRAAQLRRVADAFVAAADGVTAARVDAVQVAATEAVELALQLAEALVQREIEGRNGAADALRRAIAIAPDDEQAMELRIHPDSSISEDEIRAIAPGVALTVVNDARIEAGGCVLTAGPCRIDAQIGPALDRARAALIDLYPAVGDETGESAPVVPMGRVA